MGTGVLCVFVPYFSQGFVVKVLKEKKSVENMLEIVNQQVEGLIIWEKDSLIFCND